jgi:hypothetical protein
MAGFPSIGDLPHGWASATGKTTRFPNGTPRDPVIPGWSKGPARNPEIPGLMLPIAPE